MVELLYPNLPQVAVGAVIIKDNRVLLVERKNQPGKGLWAIPGGKVNPGETLQEAAQREILEETGITCRALDPVYVFDYIDRDSAGKIEFHYVIIDFMAEYVRGEPCAKDDATDARFLSSKEVNALPVSASTLKLLKEIHFLEDTSE